MSNLKTFEVELCFTQSSKHTMTVQARNEQEANDLACDKASDSDDIDWIPFDGEITSMGISEVTKLIIEAIK